MTKKQLIIEAAIDLFSQKGIESTSIQQITDKCGISKGAFYLIFKSKEALILSIIDHFLIDYNNIIDQSVKHQKTPDEKLYQYFFTSLQFFNNHKALALIFLREQLPSIGEEGLKKLLHYETLGTIFLAAFLDELYGAKVKMTKYDLIVMMSSMLNGYINKLLFTNTELDFEKIAHMFVEKLNILAEYSTLHVLDEFSITHQSHEVASTSVLLQELDVLKQEVSTAIHLQSIELLTTEIQKNEPNLAIIFGVSQNLNDFPRGKWVHKLITNFFQ